MSQVYVSTYAKYNSGSLAGLWVTLEGFDDKEEFLEYCKELHGDEEDPELMFQDWEGVHNKFHNESYVDDSLFEFLSLSEEEQNIVGTYWNEVDRHTSIAVAMDNYAGTFDSPADWAYDYWEQTGVLDNIPGYALNYIDFEAWARDARYDGISFVQVNGGVMVFYP